MLPGLKEKLIIAVTNRVIILLITAPGESTRQIEPWLLWESKSDGLMLIGRQTHGHGNGAETLPAWRKLRLSEVTQLELTRDRFEPAGSDTYKKSREQIKRKPLAEVLLDSEYTELSDEEHAPPPALFSSTTRILKR